MLIEQIKFFHCINLRPISKGEQDRWERVIEENLINMHNLKQCYIPLNKQSVSEPQPQPRVLRVRKKSNVPLKKICEPYVLRVRKKILEPRVLRVRNKSKRCCKMCGGN